MLVMITLGEAIIRIHREVNKMQRITENLTLNSRKQQEIKENSRKYLVFEGAIVDLFQM